MTKPTHKPTPEASQLGKALAALRKGKNMKRGNKAYYSDLANKRWESRSLAKSADVKMGSNVRTLKENEIGACVLPNVVHSPSVS